MTATIKSCDLSEVAGKMTRLAALHSIRSASGLTAADLDFTDAEIDMVLEARIVEIEGWLAKREIKVPRVKRADPTPEPVAELPTAITPKPDDAAPFIAG